MREPARKVYYMAPHKTITVNGRVYDAVTGLPVDAPSAPSPSAPPKAPQNTPSKPAAPALRSTVSAGSIHGTVQHAQTLNRRATKKPVTPSRPITRRPPVGRQMDIAKSTAVSRFAKHPVTGPLAPKSAPTIVPDAPAQSHPIVHRAFTQTKAKTPSVKQKHQTPKEVKDAAITKALATPKAPVASQKRASKKHIRRLIIIVSVILLFITAFVCVYRLFPGISVSIASAQAGLSATYPEFTPDGYSLSQPVTYTEGEVTLKFHSNSNDNYYTISQTRSSWDSSATLDNVVTPEAGADYVTTKERGLTIYTYKSVAVWVNGGILYKIDSKAPLSGDQIRRIATSL